MAAPGDAASWSGKRGVPRDVPLEVADDCRIRVVRHDDERGCVRLREHACEQGWEGGASAELKHCPSGVSDERSDDEGGRLTGFVAQGYETALDVLGDDECGRKEMIGQQRVRLHGDRFQHTIHSRAR